MLLPPALEALLQLILCGCMGNCTTGHCTCKRNGLSCSDSCQCGDSCDNPHNYDLEEESEDDEDTFYVFGGDESNRCDCYCPQDDSWRSLPKMKEERLYAGSCYDNNKFIYVVGGSDERNQICLTSMERFDVVIEQWSSLKSSIGVGRLGLTLTVFKNQIILIGGEDEDKKKCKSIQKYDSISDS
ncbi:Kelch-like ECH-associated protein 1 [Nymphon striatum]|nr:Kelch-like ECH-associated protein 1 [Nymphon striatum]